MCNAWPYQASSKLETWQVSGGSLTREKEEAAHARCTVRYSGDGSSDELAGEDRWVVLQCSPVLPLGMSRQTEVRTADVEALGRRCLLDREELSSDGASASWSRGRGELRRDGCIVELEGRRAPGTGSRIGAVVELLLS
jgi:hypothetical protein